MSSNDLVVLDAVAATTVIVLDDISDTTLVLVPYEVRADIVAPFCRFPQTSVAECVREQPSHVGASHVGALLSVVAASNIRVSQASTTSVLLAQVRPECCLPVQACCQSSTRDQVVVPRVLVPSAEASWRRRRSVQQASSRRAAMAFVDPMRPAAPAASCLPRRV